MLLLPAYISRYPLDGVENYPIMASSKNAPIAWEWIKFLVSQPAAAGKLIPPLKTQVFAQGNPYGLPADLLAVASRLPEKLLMSPPGMRCSAYKVEAQTGDIYFKAAMQAFTGQPPGGA